MEPCKFEDIIREMHGDVKVLISEFRTMNGALKDTRVKTEEHMNESNVYRRKIDIIWAVIHTMKWAIFLLFGTGIIWKALDFVVNK